MDSPATSSFPAESYLLQDLDRGLHRWFASRLGARHQITADMLHDAGTYLTMTGHGLDGRMALARAAELAPGTLAHRFKHAIAWVPLVRAAGDDVAESRTAFEREIMALLAEAETGAVDSPHRVVGSAQPFYLAYQDMNNVGLLSLYGRLCATLMAQWQGGFTPAPTKQRAPGARVRVGIASSHVFTHSVWQAITRGWVVELDRKRFVVVVFHLGSTQDEATAVAKEHAQVFVTGRRSVDQWATAIVDADLDVLLYPDLGMNGMTLRLAALRLAPVQAASWGHPETSGLPTIDHYLSAERFEGQGSDAHYSEALVCLPALGCCVVPTVERLSTQANAVVLADIGVRPGSNLYVCAGTPFKYAPEHDAVLVRIAQRVPDAQFLFFSRGVTAPLSAMLLERLRAAFTAQGLDPATHLLLTPWMTPIRFFAVLSRARVFLDTIGFSGFNTVLQAVECGLPVVTRRGTFMRGRFGSGILEHLGLGDLVAADDDAYVALAVQLAQDESARAAVRARMAARRDTLYNDKAPIRALEDHLWRWAAHAQG